MPGPRGRLYIVEFHAIAVTAQQDLIYLKPAADKPIVVHGANVVVTGGTADAGDAQEELLRIEALRLPATVTVGSGGNSFTPNPKMLSDAAAGFTARINDTTVATTSGTAFREFSDGMNNRIPWIYAPIPEDMPMIFNAQALVIRLVTTPNDSIEMGGTCLVEEFG